MPIRSIIIYGCTRSRTSRPISKSSPSISAATAVRTSRTTPFSLKDMADDVLGVCRDESVKEAILGGVSVGSGMALLLGLDHPEMFKASDSRRRQQRSGRLDRRANSRLHKDRHRKISHSTSERTGGAGFSRNQTGQISAQHLSSSAIRGFPENPSARFFAPAAALDMTPRLGSMKVPTLVINGEYDNSLKGGQRTASLIPGAVHKDLAQDRPRLQHRRSGRLR